jgi:ARP2/3 complex ARPC3 (21 kDa) subunit
VSPLDVDPDSESYDILDETLSLFRANTFFRNFEIKGPADRLLIYGILFISECLSKVKANMDTGCREGIDKWRTGAVCNSRRRKLSTQPSFRGTDR